MRELWIALRRFYPLRSILAMWDVRNHSGNDSCYICVKKAYIDYLDPNQIRHLLGMI